EMDPNDEFVCSQLNQLKHTAESSLRRAKQAEKAGELAKAIEYVRSYIGIDTNDDDAFAESALLFDRLAQRVPSKVQLEETFSVFEKAIGRCPNRTDLLRRSAAVAMQLERYSTAQAHLNKLVELDPKALNDEDLKGTEKLDQSPEQREVSHLQQKPGESNS